MVTCLGEQLLDAGDAICEFLIVLPGICSPTTRQPSALDRLTMETSCCACRAWGRLVTFALPQSALLTREGRSSVHRGDLDQQRCGSGACQIHGNSRSYRSRDHVSRDEPLPSCFAAIPRDLRLRLHHGLNFPPFIQHPCLFHLQLSKQTPSEVLFDFQSAYAAMRVLK